MLAQRYTHFQIEAGVDEVGRGCLAGPVVAAAVILPADYQNPEIADSKLLSEKQRSILSPEIIQNAIAYAITAVNPQIIDKINILQASYLAMAQALECVRLQVWMNRHTDLEFFIVDGGRFPPEAVPHIPFAAIVKGDNTFLSIAAASIIAKHYRDQYMNQLAVDFPQYQWQTNKGYPTIAHRKAIATHGFTPHHRQTFRVKTP